MEQGYGLLPKKAYRLLGLFVAISFPRIKRNLVVPGLPSFLLSKNVIVTASGSSAVPPYAYEMNVFHRRILRRSGTVVQPHG